MLLRSSSVVFGTLLLACAPSSAPDPTFIRPALSDEFSVQLPQESWVIPVAKMPRLPGEAGVVMCELVDVADENLEVNGPARMGAPTFEIMADVLPMTIPAPSWLVRDREYESSIEEVRDQGWIRSFIK